MSSATIQDTPNNSLRRRFHAYPLLLKLTFIGLATELIYITYIIAFPLISNTQKGGPAADLEILMRGDRWFALLYILSLLLLYFLFWLTMRLVMGDKHQATSGVKLFILAFGLLFSFTLVWLYPITANDLFRYVLRARIWAVYGASPMLTPPNAFPNDPYLPFAGEFGNWVSGYGPLWEIMAQVPVRWLGATGMVAGSISLKVVAWLCYLGCAALLGWVVVPQKGSPLLALTFFAWNPLILIQGLGNGHNDMVFMVLLVLGLAFWQHKVWWAAVLTLTLAVVAKAPALLMVPLFAVVLLRHQATWRGRLVKTAGAGLIGLAVTLLVYRALGPLPPLFQDVWNTLTTRLEVVLSASPALKEGWAWLTGQLGFAPLASGAPPGLGAMLTTRRGFAIASEVRMILREIISPQVAETLPRATAGYIFILFYAWLLVELWRKKLNLVTAGFLAYFGELMLGATFRIWYPMWLIPLAALHLTPATFWRTFFFSLTAELSIINYFVVWRWWLQYWPWAKLHLSTNLYYWTVMHTLTVPWLFGLPLLGPIIIERRRKTFP